MIADRRNGWKTHNCLDLVTSELSRRVENTVNFSTNHDKIQTLALVLARDFVRTGLVLQFS